MARPGGYLPGRLRHPFPPAPLAKPPGAGGRVRRGARSGTARRFPAPQRMSEETERSPRLGAQVEPHPDAGVLPSVPPPVRGKGDVCFLLVCFFNYSSLWTPFMSLEAASVPVGVTAVRAEPPRLASEPSRRLPAGSVQARSHGRFSGPASLPSF